MPDAAASRKRQIRGRRTLNAINDSSRAYQRLAIVIRGHQRASWPWMSCAVGQNVAPESVSEGIHDRPAILVVPAGIDSRVARSADRATLLDGASSARFDSTAIAPASGSKMKCILCPSNKDYCNFGAGDFKAAASLQELVKCGIETLPRSGVVIDAAGFFCGIVGGTIGVAESPHQSLDSASVECREGENRRDQCLRNDLGGKWNYLKISF